MSPYVQVKNAEVQVLTEELAQHCIDDRTADFTLALMDFQTWDRAGTLDPCSTTSFLPISSSSTSPPSSLSGSLSCYEWPVFILDMLDNPSVWAAWRKRVERAFLKNTGPGKQSKFRYSVTFLFLCCFLYFLMVLSLLFFLSSVYSPIVQPVYSHRIPFRLSYVIVSGFVPRAKKVPPVLLVPPALSPMILPYVSIDLTGESEEAGRAEVKDDKNVTDSKAKEKEEKDKEREAPLSRRGAYFQALCEDCTKIKVTERAANDLNAPQR